MRESFSTSAAGSVDFAMNRPILIIEDDPDIAEVLAYALKKAQFETRVALTGEEGLVASLDRFNPPAIILLDLLLPAMTGSELCRRLRQEVTTAFTPIIIITAKAFELDGANYLKLGANDYIVKPFSIGDVIRRVRSFLPEQHVDSTMPPPSAPG
jgi:DNA-binding response OmpR family regulator